MATPPLQASVCALLDEYKKAIDELWEVIAALTPEQLCFAVNPDSPDPECRSIHSVLTHVVDSGYGYTVYIENAAGLNKTRPPKKLLQTSRQYKEQLYAMFAYCESFFRQYPAIDIEEKNPAKKIYVNWGQVYNIEQLLEHAIVHVLRHRRQVSNYIKQLHV